VAEIASAVYRLALALWVGGIAVFTFIVTPVIFRTQPRNVAGGVVGEIFPLYFRYGLIVIAAALAARFAAGEAFPGTRRLAGTALVLFALALGAAQTHWLAPKMEAIKARTPAFETAADDHPARRAFMRLHGISMVLNLLILADGAVLIVAYEALRR
jgi:putative copper export protein